VASVPLQLCLTVEAAMADATLGDRFAELLGQGVLDERSAVVLLLLLEAGKGDASDYAPWLQLLPTRCVCACNGWRVEQHAMHRGHPCAAGALPPWLLLQF
jgi:hypothetical protein